MQCYFLQFLRYTFKVIYIINLIYNSKNRPKVSSGQPTILDSPFGSCCSRIGLFVTLRLLVSCCRAAKVAIIVLRKPQTYRHMSNAAASFRPNAIELGRIFTAVSSSPKAEAGFEEGFTSFSTTDGSMVAYTSGASAVSAGAGIFFGGYFVGGADDSAPAGSNMPFIKY